VDAISDDEAIDWHAVRRSARDESAVRCCLHLETLSKISRAARPDEVARTDVPASWLETMLLALAVVQITLGIIGALAYREHSLANTFRLLTLVSFGGMGVVLRRSRGNARANDLGAVFLLCALGFGRPPYMLSFDVWFGRSTFGELLRSGLAIDAWGPYFFWRFARRFPTTTRFTVIDRTATAGMRIAGAAAAALFAINLLAAIAPSRAGVLSSLALSQGGSLDGQRYYSATIFALALPALPIIFARARVARPEEKGRVRLFAAAMVAGIAPTYLEVILEAVSPRYLGLLLASKQVRSMIATTIITPLLCLPYITGYSVLVHQLLDIRLVVRQGASIWIAVGRSTPDCRSTAC